MKTEYLFIPSACIAMFGIYNICKLKKRLSEIENLLMPTIESLKLYNARLDKIETIALPCNTCEFEL